MKRFFALAAILMATPSLADGLIENVNGVTLDESGKVVRFNGMLISKDGKVTQLLSGKDKPPKIVDFKQDDRCARARYVNRLCCAYA
jgi:hypothetical protein